ncbi:MAG TPA: tetratricopeptide repeat protein [Steroidobacteraceae bacterium]|nr:tetratricopeptide repeat protein [Steroidobacteraceae bacterium]
MRSYSVRDVERVLRLSPDITRALVKAGFVKPARGARREYLFSFQDLIVLRTARALIDANIPARRIRRSLASLRRELPETVPLSGLSISAVGDHVVVRDGEAHRQIDSGQYLLGLDVTVENGVLHVVERPQPPASAAAPAAGAPEAPGTPPQGWFAEALELESHDPDAALSAWRHAADEDPRNAAAWTNWGRLLHEQGRTQQAAEVYRQALTHTGPDALLLFNQGVLLEDLGDPAAALDAYQTALAEDPDLADCHYNLARLYESLGQPQHAIRHLGQYRRLVSDSR